MATEINKTVVEIEVKGDKAQRGLKQTSMSFTEFNQALELGKKALQGVSTVINQTGQALERGFKVDNVTRGFQQLTQSVEGGATQALENYRKATQGLIGDTDLMAKANEALTLGLSPKTFEEVSAAATKLSLSMGKDVTDGINSAVTALSRQSQLMLDNLGVTLTISEAQELYAAKLGKSVKALSDQEKAQAFATIAAEKLIEKSREIADVSDNAGVEFQKLKVAATNLYDEFARGISNNEELAKALGQVRESLGNIDVAAAVEAFANITTGTIKFIDTAKELGTQLLGLAGSFQQAAEMAIEFYNNFKQGLGLIASAVDATVKLAQVTGHYVAEGYKVAAIEAEIRAEQEKTAKLRNEVLAKSFEQLGSSIVSNIKDSDTFKGILKDYAPVVSAYNKHVEKMSMNNKDSGFKPLSKEAEKAAKEIAKARKEFQEFGAKQTLDSFRNKFDKALELGNFQAAEDFKAKYLKALEEVTGREMREKFGKGVDDAKIGEALAKEMEMAGEALGDEMIDGQKRAAEEQDRLFEESASYFGDLIFDAMTGSFRDSKEMGKRILADIGGSFLAGLTGGTDAQGGIQDIGKTLGKQLAGGLKDSLMGGQGGLGSIFGGGKGGGGLFSGLGSLFGGGSAPGLTGEAGFFLPGGNPAATAGLGAGGGMAGLMSTAGPLAAAAAGIALSLDSARLTKDAFGGGANSNRAQASLGAGLLTGGILAPLTAPVFNKVFDTLGLFGAGKGKQEEIARTNITKEIEKMIEENVGQSGMFRNFSGGLQDLTSQNFNIDFGSGGLAEQAIGIASPLATLLSGGNSKLKDDLTGIFSNEVTENASSLNEAMLNMSMLMSQMGVDAEQAKDQFKNLFLDGEIGIEEFGSGIQNLNLLAQENLVGENSIYDALTILTKNFDSPRAQLKALELLFNEFKEAGVRSVGELGIALTDVLGPEAVEVFNSLEEAGITSFENLEGRSADEIFLIGSQLSKLEDELKGSFSGGFGDAAGAAGAAAEEIEIANKKIEMGLDRIKTKQNEVARGFRTLNNLSAKTPEDVNKNMGVQ